MSSAKNNRLAKKAAKKPGTAKKPGLQFEQVARELVWQFSAKPAHLSLYCPTLPSSRTTSGENVRWMESQRPRRKRLSKEDLRALQALLRHE